MFGFLGFGLYGFGFGIFGFGVWVSGFMPSGTQHKFTETLTATITFREDRTDRFRARDVNPKFFREGDTHLFECGAPRKP